MITNKRLPWVSAIAATMLFTACGPSALDKLGASSGSSLQSSNGTTANTAGNTTGTTGTSNGSTTGTTTAGAAGFSVKIMQANNFSAAGLVKIEGARSRLEQVVNSDAFHQAMLNHGSFSENQNMSPEQIYQYILTGAEPDQGNPVTDHTMNLYMSEYTENSSTVGYTNSGDPFTYVNSTFFDTYDFGSVANNMMHEWLHRMGFTHYNSFSGTVPYDVGDIVDNLVRAIP